MHPQMWRYENLMLICVALPSEDLLDKVGEGRRLCFLLDSCRVS
jgi:hypothetical protein